MAERKVKKSGALSKIFWFQKNSLKDTLEMSLKMENYVLYILCAEELYARE